MVPRALLRRIRRIEIRTSRVVDEALAGRYHSAFRGRGMEFEEVRPYQPGDDVRAIDWNVSARQGEPFIKIFREERELSVIVVADLSASLRFGTRAQLKRELVTEIGATLAFSATRNNDRVGLLLFTDRVELWVPPKKGRSHVLRVIRELLAFPPVGTGTDLAAALQHLGRIQRRRAVVFVLSDFAGDGWEAPLRLAARRHDVIPVRVRDPLEETLPDVGLVEVVDPETGAAALLDAGSARVRRAYAAMRAEREAEVDARLRRLRLDSIVVRTGSSYVEPIARHFRLRERRGA